MSLQSLLQQYINNSIAESAKHELHNTSEEARQDAINRLNSMNTFDALELLSLYEDD